MATAGGPGVYPTVGAAAGAVCAALKASAGRALADAVAESIGIPEVIYGDALDAIGTSTTSPDLVGVEVSGTSAGDGTTGPTRREQHVITLTLSVVSFRATDDPAETIARAWGLLDLVDDRIRRTEPDLTDPATPAEHPALWCRLRSTDSASADRKTSDGYAGRITAISATYEAAVIVQTL